MKRRTISTLRVILPLIAALVLLVGLMPAVHAAPDDGILDPGELHVGVTAWEKDVDGNITPLDRCVEPGEYFYVNAAMYVEDSTCQNVIAFIESMTGDVELAECEVVQWEASPLNPLNYGGVDLDDAYAKEVGPIINGSTADVWWKFMCTGPADVFITIRAFAETNEAIYDTDSVEIEQCGPTYCTVFEVQIIEPDPSCCGDISSNRCHFDVSNTYGVKAEVEFVGCQCHPDPVTNVRAYIELNDPAQASFMTGDIDDDPESDYYDPDGTTYRYWDLCTMECADEAEVGWTLHCDAPGDLDVRVFVTGDGIDVCNEVDDDYCYIRQNLPGCIAIEDIELKAKDDAWNDVDGAVFMIGEDVYEVCSCCGYNYKIYADICNPCDEDICDVTVKLSADDTSLIEWCEDCDDCQNESLIRTISMLGDDECEELKWCFNCTGAGTEPIVFTITVTETDDETNVLAEESITVYQRCFLLNVEGKDCDEDSRNTDFDGTLNVLEDETFEVEAYLRNCSDGTIPWPIPTVTYDDTLVSEPTLVEIRYSADGTTWTTLTGPFEPTVLAYLRAQIAQNMPECSEMYYVWEMTCLEADPSATDITVSVTPDCCSTISDSVTVLQETRPDLMAGIDTYEQCCNCDIMEPKTSFAWLDYIEDDCTSEMGTCVPDNLPEGGQIFHVVVPVCNNGETDAWNSAVTITIDGPAEIIATSVHNGTNKEDWQFVGYTVGSINGVIPAGACDKAFWLVECTGAGEVTIEVTSIDWEDVCGESHSKINTGEEVAIHQVPISVEFIQPCDGAIIEPCTDFTVKAKICNLSGYDPYASDEYTLEGVTATLNVSGGAVFAEGQPATVDLETLLPGCENCGPDYEGECAEATWQMHCVDFGEVDFDLCINVDRVLCDPCDPDENGMCFESGTLTIYQDVPDTCLEIVIDSPDIGASYATSQEFAVSATITNVGDEPAFDVVAWIEDSWGVDFLTAEYQDNIGEAYLEECGLNMQVLMPGESVTLTWTAHCNESGLSLIRALTDAYNIEGRYHAWDKYCDYTHYDCCNECPAGYTCETQYEGCYECLFDWDEVGECHNLFCGIADCVAVWQYPAAHLEVDIAGVDTEEDIHVCDDYGVVYTITNTGEADATEVEAVLTITPEDSARPAAGDNGYTQYIGTIPGHGGTANITIPSVYEGCWELHCKDACESTLNITATGLDEYGWHKKQHNGATGNFIIEEGILFAEPLGTYSAFTDTVFAPGGGYSIGLLVGDSNGMTNTFNWDADLSIVLDDTAANVEYLAMDSGSGFVMLNCQHPLDVFFPGICPEDLEIDAIGKDVLVFVSHIEAPLVDLMEEDADSCELCLPVLSGLVNVVNGSFNASYELVLPETVADQEGLQAGDNIRVSYYNGTYASNMAAESLRPIDELFIEDDWYTVKQLPAMCDIAVEKTVDVDEVMVGESVTFTVTATNNGPSDAAGVVVQDVLPEGLNIISATPDKGWYDVMSGMWTIGALAEAEVATLELEVAVDVIGTVMNRATVVASECADPDASNDSATVTVTGLERDAADEWTCCLDSEYNLISLALIPEDGDLDTMMADVVADIVAYDPTYELNLWEYDPEAVPPDDWMGWNSAGAPGALDTARDGVGYWAIIQNTDVTIPEGGFCFTYDGYELPTGAVVPPSYDVVEGWNLIGFKSVTPKAPAEYLAGIAGGYVQMYGYDGEKFFIPGTAGHTMLEPCHGYWLAVTVPGTIYP